MEELEAVVIRLPGVHSVEFDLAVAQFMAGDYDKGKGPLAKSVALRFPASELSLNLAACLYVALEHPEVAEDRSVMKGLNSLAPVIMRNSRLVSSWLENRCAFIGLPILLEPSEAIPSS
ncbi:hypothetical protein [Pseudodesulfovibrio sp.]|uniref:hypothetical protein n=1 Tax=unclassified Pseudodesulfovibrio TaxID=2661612 RepID=UPI003AFFDDE8